MALNVNNNDKTQFTDSVKPTDYEIVTVSKWRYKDYKLNELVYNIDKTGFGIYRCLKNHTKTEYNNSDGVFNIKPKNDKLWENLSESSPSSGNGGGGIGSVNDFYITDGLLTLELANGTQYDVNVSRIPTYATTGKTEGSDLLLINASGNTIATIDLSDLTGIDTHVQSGQVIGDNLVLSLNNGSSVSVDISTLAENTYVSSGTTIGTDLYLELNNGSAVYVDLSSVLAQSFLALNDTPNSYYSYENALIGVNSAGTALEYKTITTTNGYTKHKYITLTTGSFTLNNGSGLYEYNLTTSDLNAKEIVVHLNLSGIANFNHYVVNLPPIIAANLSKKITFICKEFDQTDHDYGLFVRTTGSGSNRILAPHFDAAVGGLGYMLPLEKYEVVELLFDGADWLCLNKSFDTYVSAKAVDYFTVNPPGNNDDYLTR